MREHRAVQQMECHQAVRIWGRTVRVQQTRL